jgi:SAM-dependent methyltransferase
VSASACPLCGSGTTEAFVVPDRNRGIGTERFEYRRCETCRSYHLIHPPADLGRYYPDDYYALPDAAELDRHAKAQGPKLDLLRPFAASGSLVDVGAGLGLFARAADQARYEVTAIEMDSRCCDYLDRVVRVRTIQSDAPEAALATLDPVRAITLWHVLEHLRRPWDLLEAAAERLEIGGVLLIATPNPDSLQFRVLRTRWAHIDAPRHLFLIPFAALRNRADDLGLSVGMVTSSDPDGRHWNRFGWDYALRRHPPHVPLGPVARALSVGRRALSTIISRLLAPVEQRGMNGSAYTAVFIKRGDGNKVSTLERIEATPATASNSYVTSCL